MFTTELCKPALRELQASFVKKVEPFLEAATPPLSIAALGLQKAQIQPGKHWPDESLGYWANVTYSTSKPARWILQLRLNGEGAAVATLASTGTDVNSLVQLTNANTVCCLNTGSSAPSAGVCTPIWLAIQQSDGAFVFPEDWGWLLVLRFDQAVKTATANQALRYDMPAGTVTTLGKSPVTVAVSLTRILHLANVTTTYQCRGTDVTYAEATEAIRRLLGVPEETEEAL